MAELFIAYMLGAFVGVGIMYLIFEHYHKPVGNLRIDRSIPDEPPYIWMEINEGVNDISMYEFVTLEVVNEDYMDSHE